MAEPERLRVFISSKLEEFGAERLWLARSLNETGLFQAILPEPGASTSGPTQNSCELVERSDYYVGVVGEHYSKTSEDEYRTATDCHIPRLIYVKKGKHDKKIRKLLEDIREESRRPGKGLTYYDFDQPHDLIDKTVKDLTRTVADVHRFNLTPQIDTLSSKVELYQSAIKIIDEAKRDLVVYQRTSSLLLGVKPHERETFAAKEQKFIDAINRRISGILDHSDDNLRLLYLFSIEQTRSEIRRLSLQDFAKSQVQTYKDWEAKSSDHWKIEGTSASVSGPFAVAESGLMIWLGNRPGSSQVISVALNAAMVGARHALEGLAVTETSKASMLRSLGLS